MNIRQLRRRAQRHGLLIRKNRDGYILVDNSTNGLAAPGPMTLEQVGLWLDDLQGQTGQQFA